MKIKKYLVKGHEGGFGGISNKFQLLLLKILWETTHFKKLRSDNEFNILENTFKKNHFIMLDLNFKSIAEHINKAIDEKSNQLYVRNRCEIDDEIKKRKLEVGSSFHFDWSLNDPKVLELLTNVNIQKMIYNYYGRQHFLRENPYVFDTKRTEFTNDITELFHIDQLNQVSMVLLLNDIDFNSTHMEIQIGSNKTHWDYNRNNLDQKFVKSSFKTFRCIGKAGTVYLFNAGCLFHRALIKNNSRRILHCNYTTGYNLREPIERIKKSSNVPSFIFKSYKHLCA